MSARPTNGEERRYPCRPAGEGNTPSTLRDRLGLRRRRPAENNEGQDANIVVRTTRRRRSPASPRCRSRLIVVAVDARPEREQVCEGLLHPFCQLFGSPRISEARDDREIATGRRRSTDILGVADGDKRRDSVLRIKSNAGGFSPNARTPLPSIQSASSCFQVSRPGAESARIFRAPFLSCLTVRPCLHQVEADAGAHAVASPLWEAKKPG